MKLNHIPIEVECEACGAIETYWLNDGEEYKTASCPNCGLEIDIQESEDDEI
jgi:transcription elongation factor Elf1